MITNSSHGQNLADFLDDSSRLPGETVLGVIASGRNSTLIITNLRLINQSQAKQSDLFTGSLDYRNIAKVHYDRGIPLLGRPRIDITLKNPIDGNQRISFPLPGSLMGVIYFRSVDFDPHQIVQLIIEQVALHQSSEIHP